MKKALLIATLATFLMGCGKVEIAEETQAEVIVVPETRVAENRVVYGRYYTDGTVVTADGNEWGYFAEEISEKTPYDGMPIAVVLNDSGTIEIEDDFIKGVVFDRETAIYDELEDQMKTNENWTVTRTGNDIRIKVED